MKPVTLVFSDLLAGQYDRSSAYSIESLVALLHLAVTNVHLAFAWG